MIFINSKAIRSIRPDVIQGAVRRAYELVLDNAFNMPDRMHVGDGDNTLLLMPCFSSDLFSTKLVSVFPDAPRQGLPAVNGILVLSDNTTGRPVALMDGAALTAVRTGAVGGLGVACLTREDIHTAGIFGAGVQGLSQARYLLHNRAVRELWIGDLNRESAEKMAGRLETENPELTCRIAGTPQELVAASQVVIAATTSSQPLFEADKDLVQGKTFISIGSFRPDMKEFPDAVIETADEVFADTPFAAKESGDICIPLEKNLVPREKIQPFAPLVRASSGTPAGGKTCFFKSVGMALFDLTVASAVYKQAVEQNLGQQLDV